MDVDTWRTYTVYVSDIEGQPRDLRCLHMESNEKVPIVIKRLKSKGIMYQGDWYPPHAILKVNIEPAPQKG